MDDNTGYDDACDLGQFCLNPCFYMFTKLQAAYQRGTPLERLDHQKKKENGFTMNPRSQQFLYVVTVYGTWAVIFLRLYPLQSLDNVTIPDFHRWLGYVTFLLCVMTWGLAGLSKPGDITELTMSIYDNYAYDNFMYAENTLCPTLNIRKLARSKFDRYSGKQVPRFDHFCGWLNQSIGEENYRFFLLFLLVHTLMCIYGSWMTVMILACEVDETTIIPWHRVVLAFFAVDYYLTTVLVLMLIMSVTLVSFTGFHLKNVANGMTTNEFYKWKVVDQRHEVATAAYNHHQRHHPYQVSSSSPRKDEETAAAHNNGHTAAAAPGPVPRNIYNLGVVGNFMEVLFPRSSSIKFKKAKSLHTKKM
jgi:palmitoyltransferase